MLNKCQYLTCVEVSFSNQNLQNDIGGNDEEGWLLNDDAWLQTGEGGQESGKKWQHNKWMLPTM